MAADGGLAAGIAALLRRLFDDLQEAAVDDDVVQYLASGLAEADEDDLDELWWVNGCWWRLRIGWPAGPACHLSQFCPAKCSGCWPSHPTILPSLPLLVIRWSASAPCLAGWRRPSSASSSPTCWLVWQRCGRGSKVLQLQQQGSRRPRPH